jgi:hypothetical protein
MRSARCPVSYSGEVLETHRRARLCRLIAYTNHHHIVLPPAYPRGLESHGQTQCEKSLVRFS